MPHRPAAALLHPLSVACWLLLAGLLTYFVAATLSAIHQGRQKDFSEFYFAADAMRDGRNIYAVGIDGYIYPPLLAFLLIPLVPLGLPAATTLWLATNCVLLVVSLFTAAHVLCTRLRLGVQPRLATVAVALAVLLAADKLHAEFVFGQSDLWLLLAWVLGLLWLDRRPWAAGLALGFAANIKYISLVTVPYLILRGRYRAAAATCMATLVWGLLPAVFLGWTKNLEYDSWATHGLAGMFTAHCGHGAARVSGVGDDLSLSMTSWAVRFTGPAQPNVHTVELLATVGAVLFVLLWAVYLRALSADAKSCQRSPEARSVESSGLVAIEWVGLLAFVLAFGPQTNSRHLSMLVLVFLVALLLALSEAVRGPRWPLWFGIVALGAGLILPLPDGRFAPLLCWWRWCGGVSWCLVGMYLTVLWVGRRHLNRDPFIGKTATRHADVPSTHTE